MSDAERIVLPTQEGYNLWSEIYDDEDNPLVRLEESHVDELLRDVGGLSVLDVGCGTGRHALRLAERDARVTGVDFSAGMLLKARAKRGAERVTFVEHDIVRPLPFASEVFDRVISCLVVDHIVDLGVFFAELRRVCRRSGFIVISVMHPAMELKGVQARFRDARTGSEIRPESASHQISDYVMAALERGLRVAHMSEYLVDETLASQSVRARKYLGWPLLLIMKLVPETARPSSWGESA